MKANFHERQYELALNVELIAGGSEFFAPVQELEEHLGYDIALVPGFTAVWSMLGLTEAPKGWSTPVSYEGTRHSGEVAFAASLFIQHKRAEYMTRRNASEVRCRERVGGSVPYFRVRFTPHQHAALLDLEGRVGTSATVRYAAPRFVDVASLWQSQATRRVLEQSIFTLPSEAGWGHPSCWTYDEEGESIFCSEPRRGESQTSSQLARDLSSQLTRSPPLDVHLDELRPEIAEVELRSRPSRRRRSRPDDPEFVPPPTDQLAWSERLYSLDPSREQSQIRIAANAAVIATTAAALGLTWMLAERRVKPGATP